MADGETKQAGRIKQRLEAPAWVRAMRFVVGAVALALMASVANRLYFGTLAPTHGWLIAVFGTLALSALVEAIWPNGNHGLLQFWNLTVLAAATLMSWAIGGAPWLGIFGAVLFALSFIIAAMESARGGHTSDAA